MLLLGLLLLLAWPARADNLTVLATLRCRNATDLARLLYVICNRSVLCRELYYLEGGAHDFQKFSHQLSLVALFNREPAQSTRALLATQIWPRDWAPYYLVQYEPGAPSCVDTLARWLGQSPAQAVAGGGLVATAAASDGGGALTFVYASWGMMMTYKQYMSNEHYCNDHNERLLYDPADQSFHCECRSGKVCNNSDATWNGMVTFMGVAVILLLLALIFVSVYNALNYSKYVPRQ